MTAPACPCRCRGQFDALRLDLGNGERVHVYGRPELFEAGETSAYGRSIERFGLGDHLAALERLKQKLSAEGLFATEQTTPARFPRCVGLLTGNDAAAKRDVLTAITTRFPSACVVVAETYVQGPRAAPALVTALADLCRAGNRGRDHPRPRRRLRGLLPFSDERLVRAVASCTVPIVSAVGHEQDTPLTDLAADARASTPSVAARLVVPDADELRERLSQTRRQLQRAPLHLLEQRGRLEGTYGRLSALSPRATLERGTRSCETAGESSVPVPS